MRVSLIIPAYHEAESLTKVLQRLQEFVTLEFECFVVIDDESDPSQSFVSEISDFDNRFQVILNDIAPGPSGALKTGFSKATGRTIVVLSADGSEDVSQIAPMVYLIERGASIVSASRFMQGGRLIGSPFIKGALSRIASLILHVFLRIGTKDSTNNFKAYSKEFVDSITIESYQGFEVALELVAKAHRSRSTIAEIPTIWIERKEGVSKFEVYNALIPYLRWFVFAFIGKKIF
jgi:glycosyltransferase involved in cell wall biosynthesis